MSLIPLFFDNSRLLDQHFGLGMDVDDLFTSMAMTPMLSRHYCRPWRSLTSATSRADSGSKITVDKDKYQVCLDIQQFAPEEITVKTVGRDIIVEGKHEEKEDQHGFISRHFVRKYALPKDYKMDEVASTLSSDGVLSISAPRKNISIEDTERIIPITATEASHSAIKNKAQ